MTLSSTVCLIFLKSYTTMVDRLKEIQVDLTIHFVKSAKCISPFDVVETSKM